MKPVRIEICGGIASGKTTLARLISASAGFALALEDFRANPFWGRFYEQPEIFAPEKNVCFLAQHTGEIKAFTDSPRLVCDYAVFQDLAYASQCRTPGHGELMSHLYRNLYACLPPPDLLVQVVCSVETQLARISRRARKEEAAISFEYLDSLNVAIADLITGKIMGSTHCMIIDSDANDFREDPAGQARALDAVLRALARSG